MIEKQITKLIKLILITSFFNLCQKQTLGKNLKKLKSLPYHWMLNKKR